MFVEWKKDGETPLKPTLDGAIAFWAGKDPLETYQWEKSDICACGQYAKAIGDKSWLMRNDRTTLGLWERLNTIACQGERTFGALAERAKASRREP